MAGAVPEAPAHDGKQMKCFADMSKHDDDQTPNADQHQKPTDNGVSGTHACHLAEASRKPKDGLRHRLQEYALLPPGGFYKNS